MRKLRLTKCWKRVKLGDRLQIGFGLFYDGRYSLLHDAVPPALEIVVDLIGFNKSQGAWILGTNDERTGFWQINTAYLHKSYPEIEFGPTINNVQRGWWIWEKDHNHFISKLIKSN